MSPGPRPTFLPSGILIHPAVWRRRTLAKNWGLCPSFGGAGPNLIMWPGPWPTTMPSFILIHPTVWPQYTNVTDRTDRQDRERSDSTGGTVLQTVAPPPPPKKKNFFNKNVCWSHVTNMHIRDILPRFYRAPLCESGIYAMVSVCQSEQSVCLSQAINKTAAHITTIYSVSR